MSRFGEPDEEDRRVALLNELALANTSCDEWAAQVRGLEGEIARLRARLAGAEEIIRVAYRFANEHGDEYDDHGLDRMCEEWL